MKILLVEDDITLRNALDQFLKDEGFEVTCVATGEKASELIKKEDFKLLIADFNLPGISGIEILEEMSSKGMMIPTIVITGYHTVESAVKAIKLGAEDYLKKPINPLELRIIIQRVMDKFYLRKEVNYLHKRLKLQLPESEFIGKSPAIKELLKFVDKIAQNDKTTVLISGESGTGKNLLAQLIHQNSRRKEKPFIYITCSAFPENLLESELMGHTKGAFTDAIADKTGLMEYADTGTLFLDEIGDMSLHLQAKILRVIEEKTFRKVGGLKDINVNVRVIAATNKNLEAMVRKGEFREDLFYRLNVIPINIPPLRERQEDIPFLVDFFRNKFNKELGKTTTGVHPAAMKVLVNYLWPGNVRELRNMIERAVLLSNNEIITSGDLHSSIRRNGHYEELLVKDEFNLPPQGINIENLEKNLIIQALHRSGGNLAKAARLLSMPRDKIRYRIKKYGIDIDELSPGS